MDPTSSALPAEPADSCSPSYTVQPGTCCPGSVHSAASVAMFVSDDLFTVGVDSVFRQVDCRYDRRSSTTSNAVLPSLALGLTDGILSPDVAAYLDFHAS